jgi:hypothetical protein
MSTSDKEQKDEFVSQRKRMAQGEKLNGQSMKPTGETSEKKSGGLSGMKKK